MKRDLFMRQINNFTTYDMYLKQLLSLAKNVFIYKNLPKSINLNYFNNNLLFEGSLAFFYDEVLGFLALPYQNLGKLNIYNQPINIRVFAPNSSYNRQLSEDEFILIYDNLEYSNIVASIKQYALRVAYAQRVIDINLIQQKTPRIWNVPKNKVVTFKEFINNIDADVENIMAFDNFDLEGVNVVLEPAPYLIDKLEEEKTKLWNEALNFIGIDTLNIQKKERLIRDEVSLMQGGSIAFRYNRFEPRKDAFEKINDKWNLNIQVKFYDDEPTTEKNEEKEEIEDV